jgi:hypothetical protein
VIYLMLAVAVLAVLLVFAAVGVWVADLWSQRDLH